MKNLTSKNKHNQESNKVFQNFIKWAEIKRKTKTKKKETKSTNKLCIVFSATQSSNRTILSPFKKLIDCPQTTVTVLQKVNF